MENNYLKTRFASVFERDRKMWTQILLLGFLMLFAHLSTYAQPCVKPALTITTYDATDETTADAKIRISGITDGNFRVGIVQGGAYDPTGPAFTALTAYSTMYTNGFVESALPAPTAVPGTEYTVRVYATATCFKDSTFYLPYVNYNNAPTYVDLQTTLSRNAGDLPLGASDTVRVVISNVGTEDATGVVLQVTAATGLALTFNEAPAGTSYNPATGVWTVGNVPMGTNRTLKLVYQINSRGIKEVKAEVTALGQIDLDSSPVSNGEPEDDEGQLCISTHFDYCNGDEFRFTLANNRYLNVVWQKYNGTSWVDLPTGNFADYSIGTDSVLVIKSVGDYRYIRPQVGSACAYEGCCPIKVIPGLPPILTTPTNEVICFGQPSPTIASTNIQNGYTATDHTTYGIPVPLNNLSSNPGFLADQGVFKYQWYNNNGPSNNNTNAIPGDSTLALETFPTAAGIYNYRLISVQAGHTSCTDTVDVEFRINETPIAFASSNTPICAEDTIELFSRNDAVNNPINPFGPASFQWWGPDSFTSSDSVTTRLNAREQMEGEYFVRAYYTLNGRVCADTISIPVVINPLPDKPNGIDTTYCRYIAGKRLSAILSVPVIDHTGDSLRWYEASSLADVYAITDKPDTTSLIGYNVGPYADTDEAPGQYKWWVTTVDNLGCQSHIDSVIITIRDKPVLPVVRDLAYCQNSTALPLTATTSTGGVFGLIWYGEDKSEIPGDTAATFPAPDTDSVGTFTFWVSQYDTVTGCQSDTADFDVFIKDTPDGPAVVEPTYCLNETPVPLIATPVITNTVSNALNTLTWYWNGTTSGTAPTPPTTLPGASWAYVTQTTLYELAGVDTLNCESPQSPLKITVNPLPVASVIPVSALCIGTISQNNGMLIITRYRDTDQADFNIGSAFTTGTGTAPGFVVIPGTGIISPAAGLPNPTGASQDYTVRIKNFHPGNASHPTPFECFIDVTVPLVKKDCTCPGGYCEPAVVIKTK